MIVKVPGVGPTNPLFVLVGEAPGEEEDLEGRPFVGSAGKLLNQILSGTCINRNSLYITNVFKERPPNNNIKLFVDLEKGYYPSIFKESVEHLISELVNINTNLIVACGQVPLAALCGITDKITLRRGSLYESNILPGAKVLATIHPAAALRQFSYFYMIKFDMLKALRHCQFPDMRLPEIKAAIFPTFQEVQTLLNVIEEGKFVAFDIETSKLYVDRISFANHEICFSICFFNNGINLFPPEEEAHIWRRIAGILRNPKILKIAQYGIYDINMLNYRFGIYIPYDQYHDTHTAQKIITPDLPAKLGVLTSIYTDIPYYKDENKFKQVKNRKKVTDEQYGMYSVKDSWVLPHIIRKQRPQIEGKHNYKFYESKLRLVEPMIFMERTGIKVDAVGIAKESATYKEKIAELEDRLWSICGYELNVGSFPQMLEYFTKKKIKLKTRKGKITFDKKALAEFAAEGLREAKLIVRIRGLKKMCSSYFDIGFPNDRICGSFNPSGTSSDRTACDKSIVTDTGCNMQTLPLRLKRHMYADEGHVAYEMDEERAEYVVVANIAPEPNMLNILRNNIDAHRHTAAMIYRIPIEDVSDESGSAGIEGSPLSQRGVGKHGNHGLNYDMGYVTFSRQYEIPKKFSKAVVELYHQAYPNIRLSFHKWVQRELSSGMCLTSPWGRTKLFTQRWGPDLFKSAYSFIPQQTVAYIANEFGLNFVYYNERTFPTLIPLNLVHDSVWFQIPLSVPWSEHARMIRALGESMERDIPWKGKTFNIGAECKMRIRYDKNVKVNYKHPDHDKVFGEAYEKAKKLV